MPDTYAADKAACERKKRYPDRQAAAQAVLSTKRNPEYTGNATKLGLYQCPVCHLWHIGHSTSVTKGTRAQIKKWAVGKDTPPRKEPHVMTQLAVVDTQQEQTLKYNEVFIRGDLSKLTNEERLQYYLTFCASVGLNPATRPVEFLELPAPGGGKKTVLYARKDCTDQLRALRGVSVSRPSITFQDELCIVTVDVTDKHGRQDSDVGIVTTGTLKGDFRANMIMKAVTKAKRRATLSVCGLGFLDESEIETIPDAKPLPMNLETGALEITVEDTQEQPTEEQQTAEPAPKLSQREIAYAFAKKAHDRGFQHEGKPELRYLAKILLNEEPADVWAYQKAIQLPDDAWVAAVQKANQDIAEVTIPKEETPSDTLLHVEPADTTLEAMGR